MLVGRRAVVATVVLHGEPQDEKPHLLRLKLVQINIC